MHTHSHVHTCRCRSDLHSLHPASQCDDPCTLLSWLFKDAAVTTLLFGVVFWAGRHLSRGARDVGPRPRRQSSVRPRIQWLAHRQLARPLACSPMRPAAPALVCATREQARALTHAPTPTPTPAPGRACAPPTRLLVRSSARRLSRTHSLWRPHAPLLVRACLHASSGIARRAQPASRPVGTSWASDMGVSCRSVIKGRRHGRIVCSTWQSRLRGHRSLVLPPS